MGNYAFVEWVERELDERGWRRTDLAQHGGMSNSQVTRILNREQSPGIETCLAIARAFKMSPETVLKIAGLIPSHSSTGDPEIDAKIEQIMHEVSKMTPDEKMEFLEYIRMKKRIKKNLTETQGS